MRIALDSGPAYALFDRDDKHHRRAVEFISDLKPNSLVSNIAVLTEVCHLLGARAELFLRWADGAIELDTKTSSDLPRIRELIAKYRDLAPDFADVSLVALCERRHITRIATVDRRDFGTYRTREGKTLQIVF